MERGLIRRTRYYCPQLAAKTRSGTVRSRRAKGRLVHVPRPCIAKAEGDDGESGSSPEQLFQKELQKRGIYETQASDRSSGKASTSQKEPPPFDAETFRLQLEESRKLNSEGLEGLIPRAKQLVSLGVTFFLAFAPVVLAISLLFFGIFWLYGDHFIHGGRPNFQPYVEPADLLNEPTVDPRIPF